MVSPLREDMKKHLPWQVLDVYSVNLQNNPLSLKNFILHCNPQNCHHKKTQEANPPASKYSNMIFYSKISTSPSTAPSPTGRPESGMFHIAFGIMSRDFSKSGPLSVIDNCLSKN